MIKRIALSLALVTLAATTSFAGQAKNDYEKTAPAPARDYATEAQKRLQTAMDGRVACLEKAGLKDGADYKVRSATRVSVRDGAYNDYDASAIKKCLAGAN